MCTLFTTNIHTTTSMDTSLAYVTLRNISSPGPISLKSVSRNVVTVVPALKYIVGLKWQSTSPGIRNWLKCVVRCVVRCVHRMWWHKLVGAHQYLILYIILRLHYIINDILCTNWMSILSMKIVLCSNDPIQLFVYVYLSVRVSTSFWLKLHCWATISSSVAGRTNTI